MKSPTAFLVVVLSPYFAAMRSSILLYASIRGIPRFFCYRTTCVSGAVSRVRSTLLLAVLDLETLSSPVYQVSAFEQDEAHPFVGVFALAYHVPSIITTQPLDDERRAKVTD